MAVMLLLISVIASAQSIVYKDNSTKKLDCLYTIKGEKIYEGFGQLFRLYIQTKNEQSLLL